jgi:hypothetical protein
MNCFDCFKRKKNADVSGIEMRRLEQEIAIAYEVPALSETDMRAIPDTVVMIVNPLNNLQTK